MYFHHFEEKRVCLYYRSCPHSQCELNFVHYFMKMGFYILYELTLSTGSPFKTHWTSINVLGLNGQCDRLAHCTAPFFHFHCDICTATFSQVHNSAWKMHCRGCWVYKLKRIDVYYVHIKNAWLWQRQGLPNS